MSPRSRSYLFVGILIAALGPSGTALAHAPPLGSALLSNTEGQLSLLVSNRGLLFKSESEQGWSLLCNEALGINTAEIPNVLLLADGSVLVGTTAGLRRTQDRGCSWLEVDSFGTLSTPALVADPTNPSTLYAFVYAPNAGGLRKSVDGGLSFSLVYGTSDEDYVDSLLVASADPHWIYAAGTRFVSGETPSHFLLRSTDAGQSWIRIELPLDAIDFRASLLTTDPAHADAVLIATTTASPKTDTARLLQSRDGGMSFRAIFEGLEIASARYAEDGMSLLVADQQGLHISDPGSSDFRSSSPASNLGCAFEVGGELLVCGHYAGPASTLSGVGSSRDGGASFTTWLNFLDVAAPVSCPGANTTTLICNRPWQDWTLEMSNLRAQAGTADNSVPAPSLPPDPTPILNPSASPPDRDVAASSGCNVGLPGPYEGCWLLLPLLACVRRRTRGFHAPASRVRQRLFESARPPMKVDPPQRIEGRAKGHHAPSDLE